LGDYWWQLVLKIKNCQLRKSKTPRESVVVAFSCGMGSWSGLRNSAGNLATLLFLWREVFYR
jgi:hypothetical protein